MSELLRDPRSIRVGKPTAEVDDAPEPPRADRVAPKRRFRRRLLDLLGTLWLFVFVIGAVVAAITYVQWRSVERVDVADVLD